MGRVGGGGGGGLPGIRCGTGTKTDARLLRVRTRTRSHARRGKLPHTLRSQTQQLVLNANRGQSAEAIRTAAFGVKRSPRRRKRNAPPTSERLEGKKKQTAEKKTISLGRSYQHSLQRLINLKRGKKNPSRSFFFFFTFYGV